MTLCQLRRYERSDGPDFAALLTDPRAMRYIGEGRPFDAARASSAIDEEVFAKSQADPSFYIRAIYVGEQYAGHAELFRRPGRSEYELLDFPPAGSICHRSMFIREETPDDDDAIRAVNDAAFGRPNEGQLVERLRNDGLLVFSLVAVVDDCVVGNVVFSNLPVSTASGQIDAASLAPIAVIPQYQARGVGSALIREGLQICKQRGKRAVLVLGDPKYYERFGFSAALAAAIRSPFFGPSWLAIELVPDALRGIEGSVTFPDAFAKVD